MQSKAALRALALEKRNALSPQQRQQKSTAICRRFVKGCQASFYKTAGRTFALYDAINSEVDLSSLAESLQKQGATVLKPAMSDTEGHMEFVRWNVDFDPTRIVPHASGTVPPENIDVIVCPVVAFDKKKNRLGYGGGYYDRYLARLMSDTLKVGVAFACQEVESIPTDEFDVPLDVIITEDSNLMLQ